MEILCLFAILVCRNCIDTDLVLFIYLLNMQHIGQSPLPAYEPAFDWENERALIFGQRIPETPLSQYGIKSIF